MAHPFVKEYLMTAGPTPLPPRVSQVMAEPMLYHRAPAFIEVYARCLRRLPGVFETAGDVLCFAASGTGAMESAVVNLVRPGDRTLVASCGKFGERWAELCDAHGADGAHLDVDWGRRIEPEEVDRALAESGAEVVFTTLSETSTGVVNDVAALTEACHRHGALIVVDAVSALGAVPVRQDAAGLDVVVAGSQKALMCPPGLAFASASEAALERAGRGGGGRYYLDWRRALAGQRAEPPDSPFTPSVGLFTALDVALAMIEEEGLEQVFARHRLLGRAAREAARALELDLFGAADDDNANVVTAITVPEDVDGAAVPKLMRDRYGITVAGGQGKLKGRIVRIAHCGYFGPFDVIVAIAGLEMALSELGHPVELGAGVGAAQQVFAQAGVAVAQPA